MRKALLIAGLLTGSVLFANAQILDKSPEKRVSHQIKALQKTLSLDANQSEKIKTILLARATTVDSVKASSTDKKANKKVLKALALTAEEKVTAVLNAEQQKTYAKLKETRKGKAKKHSGADMNQPTTKG